MKDVLDYLREGQDTNLVSAEVAPDLHRLIVGSSRAAAVALEPVHERWLKKLLKDITRTDQGISPLDTGETVMERVQAARVKQDALGLAEAGKISLLAAAGVGKKSKILSPNYFVRMTRAALLQAAEWNPFIDAEVDEFQVPSTELTDMAPADLDAWVRSFNLSRAPKKPVLTRVAFKAPDLVTVVRFFGHLCMSGNKEEAYFMTPEGKRIRETFGAN